MLDFAQKYGTVVDLENEGAWVDLGDGVKVKVARIGNPRYKSVFQQLVKPYRSQINRGVLSEEIQTELLTEALAEAVLVGWEGIVYQGEALDYSKENAVMLLSEFKDFREDVVQIASTAESFRGEELEESLGNSPSISSGS